MVCPGSQISMLVGCNHGVSRQLDQCVGGLQSSCVKSGRSVCWWAAIMVCPGSQISMLVGGNHGVSR